MNDQKKLKVLLTTNMPAPYMVEYLDLLGQRCELTAVFEKGTVKHRLDQWYGNLENRSFRSVILKKSPFSKEPGWEMRILKHIDRAYDRIIIGNPLTHTGIITILYCKLLRIPYILQSEGGFRGSGKGLKERFKYFLMHSASMHLSGMRGESEYFLRYGATEQTLRWYPFTSLKQAQIDMTLIPTEEKQRIRRELGIQETQVVLSVGRNIPVKGFDVLLKAKKDLPEDLGIYIVGGSATDEDLAIIKDNGLKNVHFIEHCDYDTLCKYYHAADAFVLPTRGDTWGLVINEAMANGLPVITTDRCVAGLQLIENGANGYIVPVDDAEALGKRIAQLMDNDSLRRKMAENNLDKIQPYHIANMAEHIFRSISSL